MTTQPELSKFWFLVDSEKQWYAIIKECRLLFGKNWKGMSKVRRRLAINQRWGNTREPIMVWFEVPDPQFATWVAVKLSMQVLSDAKRKAAK
jgi:hypothetical protein